MSLRHAMLGFLALAPLSGYDVKKAFDRSVRHFWPADQSQIYRTLAQLADDGLVTREVIPGEDILARKVYHITDAGRQELHRWLTTPLPPADSREPFLIQGFFGSQLSDAAALAMREHEQQAVAERWGGVETLFRQYREQPPNCERLRALF